MCKTESNKLLERRKNRKEYKKLQKSMEISNSIDNEQMRTGRGRGMREGIYFIKPRVIGGEK
jgi:hypothetical protein